MNQASLVCCTRIALLGGTMSISIDLIFPNGRELIVGLVFSPNIHLITSVILIVLLKAYMIQTYLSISSEIFCSKGILQSELNTLTNLVSFDAEFMGHTFSFPYNLGV